VAVCLLATAGGCFPVSRSSVASEGGEVRGAELDASPDPVRVDALAKEFLRLGPDVSPDEARQVAYRAVHYSEQLADWFGMVRPVEVHNVLVNLGLKRGGRCYEYAEFMLASLRELPLTTLELKRGIAWKDDTWNEHNCVVVTAVGQPFESGVVLDAWRNAGHLRFAPVSSDHYPWKLKPPPPKEMIASSPRGEPRHSATAPAGAAHARNAAPTGVGSQVEQ
jgi:hypothetical protein